jgi:hypothetical protein
MSAQQQHYITTAYSSGAGSAITRGYCVVLDSAGTYYAHSTTAARSAAGRRTSGIAISSCTGDAQSRAFELQTVGEVPNSITGLGTGTASLIRVSSTGILERVATYSSSDDVCGYCDTDGTAHVCFPLIGMGVSIGAAGGPAGSTNSLQYKVDASTFGGATHADIVSGYLVADGVKISGTPTAGQVLTASSSTVSTWATATGGLAATLTGYGNSSGVLAGSRRGIPIEFFGGVGDDSTDNAAAFLAAIAAHNAGTYGAFTLLLGNGIYRTSGMDRSTSPGTPRWPYGMSLIGMGPQSVVKLTATTNFILMQDADAADRAKFTTFAHFHVVGTASGHYGAGGGSDQNAIEIGFISADGGARGLVLGVTAYRLKGRLFSSTSLDTISYGWRVEGCLAEDCLHGYFLASPTDVSNCQASYCGTGAYVNGNTQCVGMTFENCSVGIDVIGGGNDAHGTFSGRLVHCTIPIRVGAITNGFSFADILLFEGEIDINGSVGEVAFVGGQIDATTYSLNGTTSWRDVQIGDGYYDTSSTTSGQNRFSECYDLDGLVPAWVGALMQVAPFASDANVTLTAQQSVAHTLLNLNSSPIAAARTITSALGNKVGSRIRVINKSATYTISYKWSSGGAVDIGPNAWALVGSDATNAIILESGPIQGDYSP